MASDGQCRSGLVTTVPPCSKIGRGRVILGSTQNLRCFERQKSIPVQGNARETALTEKKGDRRLPRKAPNGPYGERVLSPFSTLTAAQKRAAGARKGVPNSGGNRFKRSWGKEISLAKSWNDRVFRPPQRQRSEKKLRGLVDTGRNKNTITCLA